MGGGVGVGVILFIYNYFLGWWAGGGIVLGYAAVKIYRE